MRLGDAGASLRAVNDAFLFSIVAVNMSLASLAGLVIAFRRTGAWAAHDVYRLRQMVEWGFANAFLALLVFPVASLVGDAAGLRIVGTIALVYVVGNLIVLGRRRGAAMQIRLTPLIAVVDSLALTLSAVAIVLPGLTSWALVLLVLTSRPMIAFLMVLATLGREDVADR